MPPLSHPEFWSEFMSLLSHPKLWSTFMSCLTQSSGVSSCLTCLTENCGLSSCPSCLTQIVSCSGAGSIYYTQVDREDTYGKCLFDCHVGTTYEVRRLRPSSCVGCRGGGDGVCESLCLWFCQTALVFLFLLFLF